jgi:beta-hydroxylase
VSTNPILDVDDFPELAPLRDNWRTIRDEAQSLLESDKILGSHRHDDLAFLSFYKRGWKRFHMKWYGDFLPSAKALTPKTIELVASIPSVRSASFTLLPPGAELGKHRDPFAGALRYHLGLITPNDDKCAIWVDGQEHSWRDGEDVVFDATQVHWAHNDTDEVRVIFFADVTRPLHTPFLRGLTWLIANTVAPATQSRNDELESLGLLNRGTAFVYRVKMLMRRAKDHNRVLYYGVKHTILLALVFAIFLRKIKFS